MIFFCPQEEEITAIPVKVPHGELVSDYFHSFRRFPSRITVFGETPNVLPILHFFISVKQ